MEILVDPVSVSSLIITCIITVLLTDGPPPRLAEAGVGPRVVEGGCQLVLAGGQSVLVDTSLLSFSLVFSF